MLISKTLKGKKFDEFVQIVSVQPKVFLGVLKYICLENGRRINYDWFYHAALNISETESGWEVVERAVHEWLSLYNDDPVAQTKRYRKISDAEYETELKKNTARMGEALLSLSPYEKKLLSCMTPVSEPLDGLFALALHLMAGRSLVPFASCFVSMGLAFSISPEFYSARKAFDQLTTFNRKDRLATKEAFLKAIEPLRGPGTSKGGQWTIVRMLYAAGDEPSAIEASRLADELREGGYEFEPPSPNEWRQVKVGDPEAIRPVDLDSGLQKFDGINPDEMLKTLYTDVEYRDYAQFLPVACRFAPEVAIQKACSVLNGLTTRTGFPLRQLILHCEDLIPLVSPSLAKRLVARAAEAGVIETIPDRDRVISLMQLFYVIASSLSAREQLECIVGTYFGETYSTAAIPALKPQKTEDILWGVRVALERGDDKAAQRVLSVASYVATPISSELEGLIFCCSERKCSTLRAVAFELAVHNGLRTVREAHVKGVWSASSVDERTYEAWFGSLLLIEACALGELSIHNLLARISPKAWFAAAESLGMEFARQLASSLLQRLRNGLESVGDISPPLVDMTLLVVEAAPYPFLSIDEPSHSRERFPKQQELENDQGFADKFYEGRDRLNSIAAAFFSDLRGSDASIFLNRITIDELKILVGVMPELLLELADIVEQASRGQFVWLKNLALVVGNLISEQQPDRAVAIIRRAVASQGFVTQAVGDSLTLEHCAVWGAAPTEAMKALWRVRLLCAESDAALAREVLGAERFGASQFLKQFIQEQVSSPDSLDQAYAIAMSGYSSQSTQFVELIEKHVTDKGLTGDVARQAMVAHQNAQWAIYWANKMWSAQGVEDFWLSLSITKTCLDARLPETPNCPTKWKKYSPVFQRMRKKAIEEISKERQKKLLGQEAPDEVFVTYRV